MKIDKKYLIGVIALVVLASAILVSQADSYSAKTAIGVTTTEIVGGEAPLEIPMFDPIYISTSSQKDLVLSVSSINTIVTDTKLSGKNGETDEVVIKVKVIVDEGNYNGYPERIAEPGEVVFASRMQEIKGRLSDAVYVCTPGTIPDAINCSWNYDEAEWVQLILNTTSANSFNFVLQDLGANNQEHKITVKATIVTATGGTPIPSIAGVIGPRTLVVNEVRLA